MALIFLVGVGVLCIVLGTPSLISYFRVKRAEPTDVADVSSEMGEIELAGKAQPIKEPFEAPITRDKAVIYKLTIHADKDRVMSNSERQPFILDDGTGKILIKPDGAKVNLTFENWKVGRKEKPPAVIRSYLTNSDVSHMAASKLVCKQKRVFLEGSITPGGDVYVYGPVQDGPAQDVPEGAVQSYVGADPIQQAEDDSSDGFAHGLAGDPDRFIIANSGEQEAQKTIRGQAFIFIGVGLGLIALAIVLAFV